MFRAIVEHVLIDLIGDRESVPLNAKVANALKLRPLKNPSGRVVRRVENDRLRMRAKRGSEFVRGERPVRRPRLYEARCRSGENCVGPHQTVISRSGSATTACVRSKFEAIASRSFFAPQVIAYWLTSAEIASCAARLIAAGAGKSGKPCERLTAPWRRARRVISRITDSVKRSAFRDSFGLAARARSGWAGFIWLSSIEPAINIRVSRHDLHVLARFGERNRVHKLGRLAVRLPRCPEWHPIFTGIVRGQGRLSAAKLLFQPRQIPRTEMNIIIRVHEPRSRIGNFLLLGQTVGRRRDQLHQPDRAFAGARFRLERGLLADEPSYEHRVDARFCGPAPNRGLKWHGVGRPPHVARDLRERLRFELREDLPDRDDGDAVVTRRGGRLGGFGQ